MITVERDVAVTRSVAAVFEYLLDFTNTEQWDPGTVTTVRTDGDGPIAKGATFHNVSTYRGRQTELDYTLVTLDRDAHLVFEGVNKTVASADDMTFRPGDDGSTVITYQARFRFKGLARLAEPLLKKGFDTIADDTVIQLKRTLESVLPA